MSNDTKNKIDDALDIDIDKVIKDAEQEVSMTDQHEIDKYNRRKQIIESFKQDLKDARSLKNKKWGEALLKNSAEKLAITQIIFTDEIEEDPVSRNIASAAELANALVNTVNAVVDLDREDQRIAISQEKNDLRRMEIESTGNGPTVIGSGKTIVGIGTNEDILRLIEKGIDPTTLTPETSGEDNASTNTK